MNRIVCVGNKFIRGDDFGPRVHDRLITLALPRLIEVVDGGLAGLNLLKFFDNCERLVFVDSLEGDIPDGEILVLEGKELSNGILTYSHASGLNYVLQADRAIRFENQPLIFLVGAGAQATEQDVVNAAELCIQLVLDDIREL